MLGESFHSPGPVACFSDEDDVSGNQNNCYWTLHNESIARCKHHMQEKLVYCCTYLENPLLADLFLYSYESEFLQKLVKDKKIHEARAFNFTYRYIDDVLSINNSRFAEFLPYPCHFLTSLSLYIFTI
jgi:hypothetical protein